MWILRDLLVLSVSPVEPDYQTAQSEFTTILDMLSKGREQLIAAIDAGAVKVKEPQSVEGQAKKIQDALAEAGVSGRIRDQLVESYVESSSLLQLQGQESVWCSIFPFDHFC